MDDGVDGEAQLKQGSAVNGRARADFGQRQRIASGRAGDPHALGIQPVLFRIQRSGELVDEDRNATGELRGRGRARGTLRDLRLATFHQLRAIVQQKLVHGIPVKIRSSCDGATGAHHVFASKWTGAESASSTVLRLCDRARWKPFRKNGMVLL